MRGLESPSALPRLLLGLFVSTFSLGCSVRFEDAEGQVYEAECETKSKARTCVARAEDGAEAFLDVSGRYLSICTSRTDPFSCRLLDCKDESTCGLGGPDFECVRGRCEATARIASPEDRVRACLSGTGPFRKTPAQLERLTLARACSGACVLPAACASTMSN